MLEAELTAYLGYEKYQARRRNSDNNPNGPYRWKIKTSGQPAKVAVPRDRNGKFEQEFQVV
jgi:putative transposase